jgi:ribonuclease HI
MGVWGMRLTVGVDMVIADGVVRDMMADLWRANVDGGCDPNPGGVMGLGVHLVDPSGRVAAELSERPQGYGTSNTAEFFAVLRALQEAHRLGAKRLLVVADSRLTVGMLTGRMRAHKAHLGELLRRVREVEEHFEEVSYQWVPREKNKAADALATKAIEEETGRKRGGGAGAGRAKQAAGGFRADGAKCSCGRRSVFRWQVFKDGRKHIRQECPEHGFLRYAPKEEPFVGLAGSQA